MRNGNFLLQIATIVTLGALVGSCSPNAESGTNSSPAVNSSGPSLHAVSEGKTLQNPVVANPDSLAKGKKLFDKLCADCHGEKGDGLSEVSAAMGADEVRPSDLTDDTWERGSTDGEIFVSIRDGVGGGAAAMKGLNGRPGVGPQEMWHIVNYIRSLRGR